jgi:hypothetical protein
MTRRFLAGFGRVGPVGDQIVMHDLTVNFSLACIIARRVMTATDGCWRGVRQINIESWPGTRHDEGERGRSGRGACKRMHTPARGRLMDQVIGFGAPFMEESGA